MNFTLGLSGWTANDWSRAGNFDLMAPRAEVDDATKIKVFNALQENWFENPDDLARRISLPGDQVHGALSAWTQAGRAIYDLNKKVYRVRELSREPLPMDKLRFSNEREKQANRLLDEGAVKQVKSGTTDYTTVLTGTVLCSDRPYVTEVKIDTDQRMVGATCECSFFIQNKLYKGPCEHILATRMAHNRKG
jgi:predicted nucleic acid-binding Zn finger protein